MMVMMITVSVVVADLDSAAPETDTALWGHKGDNYIAEYNSTDPHSAVTPISCTLSILGTEEWITVVSLIKQWWSKCTQSIFCLCSQDKESCKTVEEEQPPGQSGYLQAVDSEGVPLCLSCQQACSTTAGAWDTRFCSSRWTKHILLKDELDTSLYKNVNLNSTQPQTKMSIGDELNLLWNSLCIWFIKVSTTHCSLCQKPAYLAPRKINYSRGFEGVYTKQTERDNSTMMTSPQFALLKWCCLVLSDKIRLMLRTAHYLILSCHPHFPISAF